MEAPMPHSIDAIRRALGESKTQLATINTVLAGFKTGLDRLEGQMMPIYNLTGKLRETQKNIDLSVHELRAVNETFTTATEVASTLQKGAKYDQEEYIKSIQKLLRSIAFLEEHRVYEGSGKALEQAKQLLAQTQVKCKTDIVNDVALYARYSYKSITLEDNTCQQQVSVSKANEIDVAKTNELVKCLLSTAFPPRQLLVEYGERRFKIIQDFFKGAKPATASDDAKDEIGQYLDNIVEVIRSEKILSSQIFPNEDLNHAALSYTIAPLLESLTNDVQDESTDEIFRPLDLHYLFKIKSAAFKDVLQPPLRLREHPGVETTEPWRLVGIVGKIEEGLAVTSKKKLNRFKEEISEALQQEKNGLRDGNVHPVSSNVMQFLRQLCDHVVELESLLAADQTTNVAYFVDAIIMKLIDALNAKANLFKGRDDLRAIFLVNNIFYVSNSLKQLAHDSQNAVVTAALRQTIQPKIASLGDKAIQTFVQTSYDVFDPILADPKNKLQYTRNSDLLTLESGRILKEKFSKFNATLEEIHANHKTFMVPDADLRKKLQGAATQRILPSYSVFHEKYSVIHFSKKNMDKYVKYTPANVDAMLREIFVGSAPKTPTKHSS
ncbi:unnamed protein product [Aphanomyces euteiches]|uniref:Exocyst subunit Exo70 family protein n=1 Tax=Aphanomyces euteiches TaxID=100861 RepID=A0A6G0XP35_9STRA|nr:hypothetical protein Ae201684_002952 [Aphanomyces euteiches]KAH9154452.1 hypothetical protein AeRB84_003460 [Aphanomyces euteiches]